MDKTLKCLGWWSAGGTFIMLVIIGYLSGGLTSILAELPWLFSGQVTSIIAHNFSVLDMASVIVAGICLSIPLSLLGGGIQWLFLGKLKGEHILTKKPNGEVPETPIPVNLFHSFFVIILMEEIFARWLFLGVLTHVFAGPFFFVVLFFLGNGLWALQHKLNFLNKADQKNLRVLPQFLSGLIFSYVFVKYGLLASVLVHFGHNAVLFALSKKEKFETRYLLVGLYFLVFSGLFFYLQTRSFTDITTWFASVPIFSLKGWSFWDYLLVDLSIFASLNLLVIILGYDGLDTKITLRAMKEAHQKMSADDPRFEPQKLLISIMEAPQQLWKTDKIRYCWIMLKNSVFGSAFMMIILSGLFWLLGLIISDVPFRILTLTILFCFLQNRNSSNALARDFWINLPSLYIMICVTQALGGVTLIFIYLLLRTIFITPFGLILNNTGKAT